MISSTPQLILILNFELQPPQLVMRFLVLSIYEHCTSCKVGLIEILQIQALRFMCVFSMNSVK